MMNNPADYLAGTAAAVITPAEPMWLAGWAVRKSPSRGTISDLYAKALALQDAHGNRLVIVTADLIAIPRELSEAVAAAASRGHGLRREQVLLCASHTHCGPEVRPDKVEFFHIPPQYAAKIGPYVERLTATLVDLVRRALASLAPARLVARESAAAFAVNRRKVSHGVDRHVPILDVISPAGGRIAILFGYACHNTVVDPHDGRFCGDWAGFAQAQLEREHPGAVAMFVAGAGADQHAEPRFTVELSQRYGRQLADAVGESLRGGGEDRPVTGGIRAAFDDVPLAYEPLPTRAQVDANLLGDDEPLKTKSRYLLRAMDEGRAFPPTYPCPLQVVRLGDELLMVAIGGEPVIDFAHMMRREFAGPVVWVAGYCNDMFGYVPSRAVLAEGGYEGGRSVLWSALPAPFAADTEDRVMSAARRLVGQL